LVERTRSEHDMETPYSSLDTQNADTSRVTNLPHFLFLKLSEECSEPSFAPKFWGVRVLGGVYLVEFPFQSPFRPPSWYTGFQNA